MIKSIQNDQKNTSKDQNQKNGEIGEILLRPGEKKTRLRAFARTRAKKLSK